MGALEIKEAIELLKKGEAVAFPTETVYGLGADAWNPTAVQKVFEIKGRPPDNPLIVHISEINSAEDFAENIPEAAARLMEKFWPGPLTVILGKKASVLDLITGGLGTVALRCPDHPLALELITEAGPLVAPSANRSGRPSPTSPEHVMEDFGQDFPVVNGGRTAIGLESTVLDVTTTPMVIYRPGKISREELEKASGQRVLYEPIKENRAIKSPGTRYTHYAPDATVRWLEHEGPGEWKEALYLLHGSSPVAGRNIINYTGDFRRMASELYDRFRQADREGFKRILIQQFDPVTLDRNPIARALYNRITKAVQA